KRLKRYSLITTLWGCSDAFKKDYRILSQSAVITIAAVMSVAALVAAAAAQNFLCCNKDFSPQIENALLELQHYCAAKCSKMQKCTAKCHKQRQRCPHC